MPIQPARVVRRILSPLENFLALESASGILLIIAAALAMFLANSPWAQDYHHFVHLPIEIQLGSLKMSKSLLHWVNDGLMVIFFFVVGLEIKRELVLGELSTPRKAALPIFGALGGMVVPALIYFVFNPSGENSRGWAVPMATDIAFAIGILSLLGKRVAFPLKIFLLALAIVDDLGAIIVIASFYTSQINGTAIGLCALAFLFIFLLGKSGVRSMIMYIIVGILAWLALLQSGVHATITGVVLGFLTPATALFRDSHLSENLEKLFGDLKKLSPSSLDDGGIERGAKKDIMREIQMLSLDAVSPLDRIMSTLHPWVSYLIMPTFAFVNAGVELSNVNFSALVDHSIFGGVFWGLVVGKPVGIVLFCFLAVITNQAQLANKVHWFWMIGVGCLGGVGFTMSLFISSLAFPAHPDLEVYTKMGILCASVVASVIGLSLLLLNGILPKLRGL